MYAGPSVHQRPGIVTLLAVLQFLSASVVLLMTMAIVAAALLGSSTDGAGLVGPGLLLMVGVFVGAIGAVQVACGVGLWKLKAYGRTIQLVLAWIGIIGFPLGTLISILILLYLNKPGVRVLFSERPPNQLTADEAAQVRAVGEGAMGMVLAVVVVVFVAVAGIGIVAAIAIPSLLRARMSANEASAISSLRAINSAQQRYSEKCNGYAPLLQGLRETDGALSPELTVAATITKSGYRVTVEPLASAVLVANTTPECAGTVSGYFAHADPVTYGTTGARYFATDSAGTIFHDRIEAIANPISESATPVP